MRILFDARVLAKGGKSGIEEYARNIFNTLVAQDRKNDYSVFYSGLRKMPIESQIGVPETGEIIDWKTPNKFLDFSSRILKWPEIGNGANVIFSPHFNVLKTKAPRVITFHDLSFVHHPDFFSWRQKFWHWLQDARAQAAEAKKIIAVSEHTKNDLISLFGIPPEKIGVVYSGVGKFNFPIPNIRYPISRPYILYLGTLEPRKNVVVAILAFNLLKTKKEFKDLQLVLAGKPGWLYRDILKAAESSPFSADIILKGQVEDSEKEMLYRRAEAFVYPSFFEGFGFPPLEAQACGCPVIAADRTSLPEILGKSAVLADPWKIGDLAEAINTVIANPKIRRQLIKKGGENAKKFSWEETARQTLKILNEAAV